MKIAHISDLHLRHHLPGTATIPERLSREIPDRLGEAIEKIQAETPDLLVVSGDLLDYPLADLNDAETLAQGEKDLRLIDDLLQKVDCPISLVHGNHDHSVLVRSIFGYLPRERTCVDHRVICFYDGEDIDNVPRRLGGDRRRFEDALADEESPPQIHVQHYVVWPQIDEDYPYNYRDAVSLCDQIIRSGQVRLVLSGHYHPGIPLFQEANTYFATVPAFAEKPHPFWIYEVDEDGITCQEMQLLPEDG